MKNHFQIQLHNVNAMQTVPHSFMNAKPILALVALLLGLVATPLSLRAADANPPDRIAYQGYLLDENGEALATANPQNYTLQFRIYSTSQAGDPLWSEQQVVTVDKGIFSVLLGEGVQIGSDAHGNLSTIFQGSAASDRYVGITVVGIGNELAPRLRLVTAPYAFLAQKANQVVGTDGATILSGGTRHLTVGSATVDQNVGVGRASDPAFTLDVEGNIRAISPNSSAALELYSFRNAGNQNKINAFAARGTETSPLALQAGDFILELQAAGYTSGGYRNAARFAMGMDSAPTATSSPGYLTFQTTPSGSTSLTERMRVTSSGQVGIGTGSPLGRLDVRGGADATDALFVKTSAANANHGGIIHHQVSTYGIRVSAASTSSSSGGRLVFNYINRATGAPLDATPEMELLANGNMTLKGTLVNSSDRNRKKHIESVDPVEVLDRVTNLPLHTWSYKQEADGVRHMGPMAQDFRAAFGLGENDVSIATVDSDGVALAAIQGLNQKLEEKDERIQELEQRLQRLEKLLLKSADVQ